MKAAERFEFATASDPTLNYCLWQYAPARAAEDKFRSLNLLLHSFELARVDDRAYEIVDAIREAIGSFRTVFGVKLLQDRLAWEFYFYDYARRERQVSISRVLEAIRPLVRCDVRPTESLPYFMFSLDLDAELAAGRRDLDVLQSGSERRASLYPRRQSQPGFPQGDAPGRQSLFRFDCSP